jgi:hypothetical protein
MKKSLLNSVSFWKTRSKRMTPSRSLSCIPRLECLGDRVLPAAGSISGYVYQDLTGNGLSSDDAAMSNVKVELFSGVHNRLVGTELSSSLKPPRLPLPPTRSASPAANRWELWTSTTSSCSTRQP